MNRSEYLGIAPSSRRMLRFMAAAWMLIAAKCGIVWWAIGHWNVPLNPLWVIVPTVMFAALATTVWATHAQE